MGSECSFAKRLVLEVKTLLFGLSKYKLVCYYTNWSQYRNGAGKFFPKDIDPQLCTHIIYAFGKLVGNTITNFEWNDNDEYNNLYAQVNAHKQQNPKLKTLLAMGGWTAGSLIYSNMASTAQNRKEFIDSSIAWLRKYNFDGLDMDWEYPANRDGKPYDKANFAHLCKETREAFDNEAATTGRERLLFTSAVGAGRSVIDTAYDVPVMAQYMDFICTMTYDLHGSWESFTGLHTGLYASNNDSDKTLNVASAAEYWHQKGVPREKLIIGLGTYGRSFTLVDTSKHWVGAPASGAGRAGPYTREKGFLSYYEICEMQRSGQGTTYRDPVAKVPYFVNPSTKLWVGFDDKTSIYTKVTDLIIKGGYGGAMIWSLPLDDFKGTMCGEGKYPLISLMKETLEAAEEGGPVGPTVGPTNGLVSTQSPSVTTSKGGESGPSKYKVVCYYTNWSQYRNGAGKFFPKDIDPQLCTHIIYAFGKLVGNKITNFEWNDNDQYNNLYAQVNAHKQQNPKLKTLLAMGGWTAGSLIYSNMASTAQNRKEFIDSAISWLRMYNFDGLDMDWEYPANRDGKPYDKANFAHLCKETREAFDNEAATTGRERLLFTSAVGAGRSVIDTAYDVPVMAQYMDFICTMTYDLHGSWESFTGLHTGLYASNNDSDKTLNVASAAEYWHQKGVPREKLIIGLGTYGRSFTLVDASKHWVGAPASGAGRSGPYTGEKGFLSYYEVLSYVIMILLYNW
ncbi:chitotriosidase-1-like [Ostrea edulis]|uniref:chitotriosidase-1-like n=1 Tax=Ostrea edulis TaxID=37623 RepID=UPI0024AFE316|nr:chitotriosidase-1-like [Ostrea edulis]